MQKHRVGTLVVVSTSRLPIGIVTDRDIVIRCVAAGLDPATTPVSEIMSTPVRAIHEAMPLDEALSGMQAQGARRLVVIDGAGALVGILAVDDILDRLGDQIARVTAILRSQKGMVPAASNGRPKRTHMTAPRMV